jgi:hypothetical protein
MARSFNNGKSASIFDAPWGLYIPEDDCDPLLITTPDNSDLAEIYTSEGATVSTSRDEAIRAARLMTAAPDLAATLELLVDSISSDREFSQQCVSQLEAAKRVLGRAYNGVA